ncbi:MAG TPA: hypothetical protein VJN18_20580 [Polyangiaceae bacterium]|nr:hypothetical protein [Polyangiaceae bacterium]
MQLRQAAKPRLLLGKLLRGWVPGALVVLLFSAGVLHASFRASDRYYDRRMVAADSSCYLVGPALVVSGKDDFGLRDLLHDPSPFEATDHGTSIYVLQTFTAWYLRDFLPLRPAMAVLLNGVWFIGMGVSVYALFWSHMRRWLTAALATMGFLLANPFLTSTTYGLTSLDPNLVGFMLGTSALCWVILSDRFERFVPCALAGLSLGALALGRVYTLGVVLPAMLPFVLACFWRRSREQIVLSLAGGVIVVAMAYVVCGWWVLKHWREVLDYPTQFGTWGVMNSMTPTAGFFEWLYFPRLAFSKTLALICVLTWPFAAAVLAPGRGFWRFNWAALWLIVCPMLVLARLGTTFKPYGAVLLLGVFLVLLFPFKPSRPELVTRGRYGAALWIACALSMWAFFFEQRVTHDGHANNKRGIKTALEAMRQHAIDAGRRRVKLGLIHWGVLHDASLIDTLVFDLGVRVATSNFQPSHRARKSSFIVDPLAVDVWAWEPKISGAASVTPESWAKRLVEEADYVLVLAGSRTQERRKGRWPPWTETSDRVRASGAFERLGAQFGIPNDGPMELLVRKKAARR